LVENAIRHGLEPKIEGGEVSVRAWQDVQTFPPVLHLSVQDSGIGMPDSVRNDLQSRGFGLAQLRERLLQRYGMAPTIAIEPVPEGGTRFHIAFPMIQAAKP
jgi:sensor histidine kinase YesM